VISSLERGTEHYDVNATRTRTLSSQNGLYAAIDGRSFVRLLSASPSVGNGATGETGAVVASMTQAVKTDGRGAVRWRAAEPTRAAELTEPINRRSHQWR